MLEAYDSGTPGKFKKPLNKITDLHRPDLTEAEKEAHIAAVTGKRFYYHVNGDTPLLIEKPEDVCPHRDIADYYTDEVAMLARTSNQQILSQHPFPIGFKDTPGDATGRSDRLKELMARYPMITLGFYAATLAESLNSDGRAVPHTDLIPSAGNHLIVPHPSLQFRGGYVSSPQLAAMTNAIVLGYYWKLREEEDDFCSTWWERKYPDQVNLEGGWQYQGCHAGCEGHELRDCFNFWHIFLASSVVNEGNKKCPGFLCFSSGNRAQWFKLCKCDEPNQPYGGNPGGVPCMKMRLVTNMQFMPEEIVGS
mmetsp:Transcript_25093/g.54737  ORF Transcript_25093/g.54737 Transcript_25093/m.54737 type:complete len:308 (+) Transcript_25093:567-1490(+)